MTTLTAAVIWFAQSYWFIRKCCFFVQINFLWKKQVQRLYDISVFCKRINFGILIPFGSSYSSWILKKTKSFHPIHKTNCFIFYLTQVSLGSDLWVRMSVTHRRFAHLTDVTLADEDTKPILTDNANRAIQGNVATKVMQLGSNFANNAGGAT